MRSPFAGRPGRSQNELATPAGFEDARNDAKPSETDVAPSENPELGSVTPIVARLGFSKCSKTAHLAMVAANAVKNGDLDRALEILDEIKVMGVGATRSGVGRGRE